MKKAAALGLLHGANDCIAGYLLGSLLQNGALNAETGFAILAYNVLAFGGQVPFALLAAEKYRPKIYLAISVLFLAAALLFGNLNYKLSILFAGIASAVVHVVGGFESAEGNEGSSRLGVFASPGVIGLAAGGWFAFVQVDITMYGLLSLLAVLFVTLRTEYSESFSSRKNVMQENALDAHGLVMIVLLMILSLRSAVWNIFQVMNDSQHSLLVWIGLAAMAGKLCGGFLADKFGTRRYSVFALVLSIPFLTILKKNFPALCIGIFLLQSTVPPTARMMIGYFRGNNPMGVAMSFGLPILLGGALFMTPLKSVLNSDIAVVAMCVIPVMLMLVRWDRMLQR